MGRERRGRDEMDGEESEERANALAAFNKSINSKRHAAASFTSCQSSEVHFDHISYL